MPYIKYIYKFQFRAVVLNSRELGLLEDICQYVETVFIVTTKGEEGCYKHLVGRG